MPANYAAMIKQRAAELGFLHCGISKAEFLEDQAPRLEKWLKEEKHGKMGYMANHFDMRLDPRLIVDGAQSVISLAFNYYAKPRDADSGPRVSRYAYGEDYHFVLKDKLHELLAFIRETAGEVNGRVFVDSAPVLERAWAQRSGLGWIGKNSMLLHQKAGSYLFLAEIITDLHLEPDGPVTDHCGTCTRCIDACPTDAIVAPREVDGSKCISYFTIELKENIPEEMKGRFGSWAFGCDICQEVCPWNRFATPHREPRFNPQHDLLGKDMNEWKEITEEVFRKVFKKSPLKRTGYNGLRRNLDFISEGSEPLFPVQS
jgi:epoxyqueuosine reductase